LSEYNFEIKHIKGKENRVANALSRRDYEKHITSINMFNIDLKEKKLEATNLDQQ